MTVQSTRLPEHSVDPLFTERWSSRAFSGEAIPEEVLFTVLEAARWAPSARNEQPWRFVVVRPGTPTHEALLGALAERNRLWAGGAAALVVLLSKTAVVKEDGVEEKLVSHSFDAGAAWANLALQAHLLGWSTRAIGGLNREAVRKVVNAPELYAVEVVVAIGRRGERDSLHESLRGLEQPNGRRSLKELVFEDRFGEP